MKAPPLPTGWTWSANAESRSLSAADDPAVWGAAQRGRAFTKFSKGSSSGSTSSTTPGHVDFTAEGGNVHFALLDGRDPRWFDARWPACSRQSETVWRQATKYNVAVPRFHQQDGPCLAPTLTCRSIACARSLARTRGQSCCRLGKKISLKGQPRRY